MTEYYLEKNNDSAGPFTLDQLLDNGLTVNSQVWSSETETWAAASALPEVAKLLEGKSSESKSGTASKGSDDKTTQNQAQGEYARMSFSEAVKYCYKNQFDFSSRARRSEFWWFTLYVALIFAGTQIIKMLLGLISPSDESTLFRAFYPILAVITLVLPLLIVVLPMVAVNVRRLHDTNHSGWLYYLNFVFIVGFLVLNVVDNFSPSYSVVQSVYYELGDVSFYVLAAIVIIVNVVLLWLYLRDSDKTENKYGPSPKYQ